MFKIIGADQKQYGPLSQVQIRQWIIDGRLNEHTQAQREDSSDWQPLSTFDEFADIFHPNETAAPSDTFAPPPPSASPMGAPIPTGTRDSALSAVKGPAIALIVAASLGIAVDLFGVVVRLLGSDQGMYQNMNMSNVPPGCVPSLSILKADREP